MGLRDHVVMLVGGVGGAKMALGMAHVLPAGALSFVVNTGDDFEHLGLYVCPDLDTVTYTLAGLANPATGWGVSDDTLHAMEMVKQLGGPAWFRLGDRDLGTNLMRTMLLRQGHTLTEVEHLFCARLGLPHPILPMSDEPVRTVLDTDRGTLAFQEYFVRERWQPKVHRIRFEGSAAAHPSEAVVQALEAATLIVFAPSNPFLSIDPILSISGIRERIEQSSAPRVAVTPIIGGQAVKGPTAKLMVELGMSASPLEVVNHYQNLLDGIILDKVDSELCDVVEALNVRTTAQPTLMETLADKTRLAGLLLDWAEETFQ